MRTLQETYDSLTGFDEIAIRRSFGTSISALVDDETGDQMLQARALMFIELRRGEQLPDGAAYQRAMSAPWSDVKNYFRNDDDPAGEQQLVDEQPGEAPRHVVERTVELDDSPRALLDVPYQGMPDPLGLGEQPTS